MCCRYLRGALNSEVEIYREGGTLEFRVSGRCRRRFFIPEPLFKDGLGFGSAEEADVAAASAGPVKNGDCA
jgi:hypothetical protein